MLSASAAFVLLLGRLSAQEPVLLKDDKACRCRIEVTRSVSLGDEDGPGTIDHSESVAVRDSRGNFIVRGSYSTELKVFDRSGKFIKTIGRDGEGPGEFRGVGSIDILAGDTLVVFDWGTSRYSLFSKEFEYIASQPLPLLPQDGALTLPSGDFVFAQTIFTANEIGQPLHRVTREGKVVSSFGSRTGVYRPDIPFLMSRAVARSRGTQVWSALRRNYEIDLLDAQRGSFIRSFKRDVDWFPPGMMPIPRGGVEDIEPKPFIYAVNEDEDGLLWVLIAVADPTWRTAIAPSPTPDHRGVVTDEHLYRDMVLEVIDPRRGVVLARTEMKERVLQFVGPGMLATVLEGTDGVPRIQTWTVRLVR